ncbi:TRM11 family SAM-dependent methyltransferase [Desulfurococcus amylolyticus]|uniref:TRM11 family SAM-dependent methyltransferase n=1 Tax=Desulfurococcus amylolyticus TaxID=94694 RepID=UPI00022DFE5E|nr:DNA methyltransferase [Desulfurococcus amylolyticus]
MYTSKGDTILDPMVGSGTTCIEARLLGRNCIGVDINYEAAILSYHRLYWLGKAIEEYPKTRLAPYKVGDITLEDVARSSARIFHGDARRLDKISDNSIDAVFTHPPYWNIIEYHDSKCVEGDLSCAKSLQDYLRLMSEVAGEIYRVLKPGGPCCYTNRRH